MLDTNICIFLINGKHKNLAKKLADIPKEKVCISTITIAELQYGVAKSQKAAQNSLALKQFISVFNIADYDICACKEYGTIRAKLESEGNIIGLLDMMIAGHAISRNDIIITNNTREFERVENLKVEDWTR